VEQVETLSRQHHIIAIWFKINPWTYIFNSYRDVIYYGRAPEWSGLAVITGLSVLILAASIWVFKRVEPSFAKVL